MKWVKRMIWFEICIHNVSAIQLFILSSHCFTKKFFSFWTSSNVFHHFSEQKKNKTKIKRFNKWKRNTGCYVRGFNSCKINKTKTFSGVVFTQMRKMSLLCSNSLLLASLIFWQKKTTFPGEWGRKREEDGAFLYRNSLCSGRS